MERINLILLHKNYKYYLDKILSCEVSREFCKHNLNHFIDVARIGYILNIERGLGHSKEEIYAAALLHDIGKWKQYEDNIPHEIASAELSVGILKDCGFDEKERDKIISAIKNHRLKINIKNSLDDIIYNADKISRACFTCKSIEECHWTNSKKNLKISY